MTGKFLAPLARSGRKFLLSTLILLLSLYLVSYLAAYWFLISDRGRLWIDEMLSSRLGLSCRWESATLSPFLEPTLCNVRVQSTAQRGSLPEIHAEKLVFTWSLGGEQVAQLTDVETSGKLWETLEIQVERLVLSREHFAGSKMLSMQFNRPTVAIATGAGEWETFRDLKSFRQAVRAVSDFATSSLGRIQVDAGRVIVRHRTGTVELENLFLVRDLSFEPLRIRGHGKAAGSTELALDVRLVAGSPSQAQIRLLMTASDLTWLRPVVIPGWMPDGLLESVSFQAIDGPTGPLRLLIRVGDPLEEQEPVWEWTWGVDQIPPFPKSAALEINSVSPISATIAVNMEDLSFSTLPRGFFVRTLSASGSVRFLGSPVGRASIVAAFEDLGYRAESLELNAPAAYTDIKAQINPRDGVETLVAFLRAQSGSFRLHGDEVHLPQLELGIERASMSGGGNFVVPTVHAKLGEIGECTASVIGSVSPTLRAVGEFAATQVSMADLWGLAGGLGNEWRPGTGKLDAIGSFQVEPEIQKTSIRAAIADCSVPGASFAARHIETEGEMIRRRGGRIGGRLVLSASDVVWRDALMDQAVLTAGLSGSGDQRPAWTSVAAVTSPVFSATARAVVITDGASADRLSGEAVVHCNDLSNTYAAIERLLVPIGLDGIDLGGGLATSLSGEWSRKGNWNAAATIELEGNRVLAASRDIPAQWENLDVGCRLAAGGDEAGILSVRGEGILSNFAALIGIYDMDISGDGFSFSFDAGYSPREQVYSVDPFLIQAPGGLSVQGTGKWLSTGYTLDATMTVPDLARSYNAFLKDLARDRWEWAEIIAISGSAEASLALEAADDEVKAEGGLKISRGSLCLDEHAGLDGISGDISAGLVYTGTGSPRLESRRPMYLAADRIDWASESARNISIRPYISGGDIIWDETVSLGFFGGEVELGPVQISDLPTHDWLVSSSLRILGATPQVRLEGDDLLPVASGVSADLSRITLSRNVVAATGEMTLRLFGGMARVSGIRVWEFFSPYPVWGGDLEFESMDLAGICEWLGLGRMEGRVSGSIKHLRLAIGEEIKPISFVLDVESDPGGGVISREALGMIFDMSQQASTRIFLDRSEYAFGRMGLRARLNNDRFFLWGKFKKDDVYYFAEPPSIISRILSGRFNTLRIALNSPDRELSFKDVWNRLEAVRGPRLEEPRIEYSFFGRLNPFLSNHFR